MYEKIIGEIQEQANRLTELQRSSIDALQNLRNQTGNVIGLGAAISDGDRSVSDLDTLTSTLIKFCEGLTGKNFAFVPRSWLIDFTEAIKNTANSFDNLRASIASIDAQHGGMAAVDPATFTITTKSGTTVDIRKVLSNISLNVDKAFEGYFRLRSAISAPRLSEFGELFGIFSTRRAQLDSLSKELAALVDRGVEDAKVLKAASDAVKGTQVEVARLREEAEKDRKSSGENAGESAQRLEAIRAVQKSADELNALVTNYQASFTQFQNQLDTRNQTYEKQKAAFDSLKANLNSKDKDVARLISQAEDMLKGATNAGLAGSFSQKQTSTDSELRKARFVYYVSILLLALLTLPIFLYSLPREFVAEAWKLIFHTEVPALVSAPTSRTFEEHVISLIGRAVFLIPGLLFVRFASVRHAQLFRLREDYTYKYSIAASVEGFMKQAKNYADDIAFSSYLQLAYNPTDKMDHKSDDSKMPNPLWEKFISRIEGMPIIKKKVDPK